MFINAISTDLLTTCKNGDSATSLNSLFQCQTMKKFFGDNIQKKNIQVKRKKLRKLLEYIAIVV